MHVISRRTLVVFWERHPDAAGPLRAWFAEAKSAEWARPTDILAAFPKADVLADNRVVFNIGGNKNRLIVRVNCGSGTVFIRFVGTHAQYNRINAEEI